MLDILYYVVQFSRILVLSEWFLLLVCFVFVYAKSSIRPLISYWNCHTVYMYTCIARLDVQPMEYWIPSNLTVFQLIQILSQYKFFIIARAHGQNYNYIIWLKLFLINNLAVPGKYVFPQIQCVFKGILPHKMGFSRSSTCLTL